MTSGVIYQLSGTQSSELCVVSLWSLRQHYSGPVTVFITDDCKRIARLIRGDKRLRVDLAPMSLHGGMRPHWVAKTFTYLQSPYDYSIYLDSDTVVLSDPKFLFGHLTVAKCNEMRVLDDHRYARSVRRQMSKFKNVHGPIMDQMVDHVYKANRFVVNCGMVAFAREHPILWELHHLCIGLKDEKMHDEAAIQLCLPHHNDVRYVDGAWNSLVAYDDHWEDRKIAHYHHKHFANIDRGRETWMHHLHAAMQANAAGIREWAGQYNRVVHSLLAGQTFNPA